MSSAEQERKAPTLLPFSFRAKLPVRASSLGLLSAFLLFSAAFTASKAQELSKTSKSARMQLSGHLKVNKRADAEAGVQLLETIISRVMNIPQVALTKSAGSQMLAQNFKQSSSQSKQGVDYKLAIRPKETGKVFAAPSPSVQIQGAPADFAMDYVAPTATYIAPGTIALKPSSAAVHGSLMSKQQSQELLDRDSLISSEEAESWKGSSMSKIALKNELPSGRRSLAQAGQSSNAAGFWEAQSKLQANASNLPASNMGKASRSVNLNSLPSYEDAQRKNPELASAVNKLYKLGRKLEEVQQLPQQLASADSRSRARYDGTPRSLDIQDERPLVKDARSTELASAGASASSYGAPLSFGGAAGGGAGYGSSGNSANAFDSQSGSFAPAKKAKAEIARIAQAPSPPAAPAASPGGSGLLFAGKERDFERREQKSDSKRQIIAAEPRLAAKDKIALLPPNVATGIPLVGLGSSETQTVQSLGRIGKLKQQKIKNWTVYSWTKKDSTSESLQLFFKHGQLDAIRIYDPSLIASDFGVLPGDQLAAVKERFGEPAFLLPEPGSSVGGKNYIYPISQVGFQLVRQAGEGSPLVQSVLIFSVK
ncbi:MAG: hypothetical protein K2X27_20150 [Candidatus Obscuribacterales bacterium]|nr:hypothetical protein [Candidatus Obscuribacterales bacterium]